MVGPSTQGCVNSRPVAIGSQEAGFTQPRAYIIAYLCINSRFTISPTVQRLLLEFGIPATPKVSDIVTYPSD